uniref:Uncharacterized protein n=1 Tax=Caenorhabditis tropicalis TaxID=1561998 RepID=A0A1I7UVL4_9PELO
MNPLALELKNGEDESANYRKLIKRNKDIENNESQKAIILEFQSKEHLAKNLIDMLIHLDFKLNQFRSSAYNPTFLEYQTTSEQLINCGSKIELANAFGPMEAWPNDLQVDLPKVSKMRQIPDFPPNSIPLSPVLRSKKSVFE